MRSLEHFLRACPGWQACQLIRAEHHRDIPPVKGPVNGREQRGGTFTDLLCDLPVANPDPIVVAGRPTLHPSEAHLTRCQRRRLVARIVSGRCEEHKVRAPRQRSLQDYVVSSVGRIEPAAVNHQSLCHGQSDYTQRLGNRTDFAEPAVRYAPRMLTAKMTDAQGRLIILLGLAKENWERLAPHRDEPLVVRGEQLGLEFDVVVFTGRDERTMAAQLRERAATDVEVVVGSAPPPTAPDPRHASVDHGGLPHEAMRSALQAAHHELVAHGVRDPALVLIAQDPHQQRGLATTVRNPADLLRVVLYNLERAGA